MRKLLLTVTAIVVFNIVLLSQVPNDTIQQLQIQIEKLELTNEDLTDQIINANSAIENIAEANAKMANQLNTTNSNIKRLERELSITLDSLNALKEMLLVTQKDLQTNVDHFRDQIKQTSDKSSADHSKLSKTVSKNTLYWIIAVVFIAVLSVFLFGWLKKQLSKEKTGLSDQIRKTSDSLREEQLKLDGQLIKLLETQMQLMNTNSKTSSVNADEVNHSLALKVADEIIRIQQNLSNMDSETKGLKQLSASVKRIQANFEGNGYEIVDMLNKPYDAGMKVTANFKPDENLKPNEQIITRIIKPQVNFKGVMIQSAQIEVSQGE